MDTFHNRTITKKNNIAITLLAEALTTLVSSILENLLKVDNTQAHILGSDSNFLHCLKILGYNSNETGADTWAPSAQLSIELLDHTLRNSHLHRRRPHRHILDRDAAAFSP